MQKGLARYAQIVQYYQTLIDEKKLHEGERLPTEQEIGLLFHVSRITVRQAMNEMEQAGYIRRIQGKGSFVRNEKLRLQLNRLQGFTEEMQEKGMTTGSEMISRTIERCKPDVAAFLKLDADARIISIERVRYADGIPMALEHVHIPFHLCPGLESEPIEGSLYNLLSGKYQLEPVRASQSIEAGPTNAQAAELLQVKAGAPALIISRTTFLADGTPLEYVVSVYRGDRYSFRVDMGRNPGSV